MARRAERLFHRAHLADQQERVASHVTGDQDRLSNRTHRRWQRRMSRPERARRALAMNAQPAAHAIHRVLLEFRDIVADVVDKSEAKLALAQAERLHEGALGEMHHDLPVTPCEIRGRRHRAEVRLTLVRANRHRRELPIRKFDRIAAHSSADELQVVVAGLMAEPTRARMDDDGDLAELDAERARRLFGINLIDAPDFEKVISRAERAELFAAAVIGVIGYGIRIGHLEAPVFFGMVEVGWARVALARGPSGAIAHKPLEFHEAERRDR